MKQWREKLFILCDFSWASFIVETLFEFRELAQWEERKPNMQWDKIRFGMWISLPDNLLRHFHFELSTAKEKCHCYFLIQKISFSAFFPSLFLKLTDRVKPWSFRISFVAAPVLFHSFLLSIKYTVSPPEQQKIKFCLLTKSFSFLKFI